MLLSGHLHLLDYRKHRGKQDVLQIKERNCRIIDWLFLNMGILRYNKTNSISGWGSMLSGTAAFVHDNLSINISYNYCRTCVKCSDRFGLALSQIFK